MDTKLLSRRRFLYTTSVTVAGSLLLSSFATCQPLTTQKQKGKKLGIALVGLGSYSSGQLAPALQVTKDCYLAGIVTGTPAKEKAWAERYEIPPTNIYNYENFDAIKDNKDIDIVYVVLPVSMHKEFTVRAAKAGKHVICEKPMALNTTECRQMIDACNTAGKMLSIGYRLHFEPNTIEMMRLGQQKIFGKVTTIKAGNGFTYRGNPNAWRLKKALAGGGGLMDMGIYTIQGARYVTGEEPTFVTAREEKTDLQLFKEVDETVYYELQFPGGATAHGISSYNRNMSYLQATAEKGTFELEPAFYYNGIRGNTSNGLLGFDPNVNQQAAQMDDFAQCIINRKPTRVPGEEGLKDMKVIEAIYKSIASGKGEKIE